jgi:hypothetical protein
MNDDGMKSNTAVGKTGYKYKTTDILNLRLAELRLTRDIYIKSVKQKQKQKQETRFLRVV